MSLIDSICIGRISRSVTQLAALGPCSLIFSFSSYIWNALAIATVTLVADRLKDNDTQAASLALSCSMALAVVGGLVVCGVLETAGPWLLARTGAEAAILPHALTYLRIRALAAPASIVVQVAQAGLLGQRDSLSPFRAVVVTSTVSLVGDLVFIGPAGMGLAGAAWTTVLSQYLGVLLLLRAVQRSRAPVVLQLPGRRELRSLLDTFGLLTVFYVCKNVSYLMIQATATRLSALLLAAHQPLWSLWNLAAFTNTPLEQAALAFLPSARGEEERRETAALLLAMGALSGLVGAMLATGLPGLRPDLFVADPALWPHMRSVGLQGVLALICCGIDVASTGVLLALKDTAYVAQAMAVSMSLLGAFLWWTRLGASGVGLGTVWWGLAVFFFLRAAQSLPRVLHKYLLRRGKTA
ncbi:hypothetical protein N2152v2_009850 [Parachlorella kessleri]